MRELDILRSIWVFRLIGRINDKLITWKDVEEIKNYIQSQLKKDPSKLLLRIGPDRSLYMSLLEEDPRTSEVVYGKFGWARAAGLPETLDERKGRVEYLSLPDGVYLYEPMHFILFNYKDRIILIHEFNFFAPRSGKLSEYFRSILENIIPGSKIKLSFRREYRTDIAKLLERFSIVNKVKIVARETSLLRYAPTLEKSRSIVDLILKGREIFGRSREIAFIWTGEYGEVGLDINTIDILEIFSDIGEFLKTFRVTVRRPGENPVEIDLVKEQLSFKKRIRLARDERGRVLRVTDTTDAIRALKEVMDEVKEQIGS